MEKYICLDPSDVQHMQHKDIKNYGSWAKKINLQHCVGSNVKSSIRGGETHAFAGPRNFAF